MFVQKNKGRIFLVLWYIFGHFWSTKLSDSLNWNDTLFRQLVAKRLETLLPFEANFRDLDNYNVYPPYPPPYQCCLYLWPNWKLRWSTLKRGRGSKCQWTVSFVKQDVFFMKKSFFTDSVSTIFATSCSPFRQPWFFLVTKITVHGISFFVCIRVHDGNTFVLLGSECESSI